MTDPEPKNRFSAKSFRIMHEATEDLGFSFFQPGKDLPMLLAFLERFDRLGWFPPIDAEKRRLLAVHDVIMHVVRDDLCFYEFCSKGARGERDPWLSIFFHVTDRKIRICALEPAQHVAKQRSYILKRVESRVRELSRWLRRHKE